MLMFPETIDPLYCPPCRSFAWFGGNAALGGFGVRPLLSTRIDDAANPVPLPFPMNSLPSATATDDGYWPVGMNPRIFDFAVSSAFDAACPPRAFSDSVTTAIALLWALAAYRFFSSALSATPSGLAPGRAFSARPT